MQAVGLQSIKNGMDHEQRWVERDAAASHNKLWGESYKPVEVEGEEMHIGDDNSVVHQYLPAAPVSNSGSTVGTLAKWAMAAGLLATGVGAPVAGWLIADGLKNQPVPVVPAPAVPAEPTVDTDTQYEIGLDP